MKTNFRGWFHQQIFYKTVKLWAAIAIFLGSCAALCTSADDQYKVQTAFIYQFTNYITWSQDASKDFFIISVIGNTPLTNELEQLAKIKVVKGRKILIHQIMEPEQLKKSDIIIIAAKSERILEETNKKAKGSGALVISAAKGFAEKGSMINFYVEDGRIRFEINRSSLENEKLQASSQLLKLAKLVE